MTALLAPVAVGSYGNAVAVHSGSEGTGETESLGSKMGDVQFVMSRTITCDTCIDGVDEEYQQFEAGETTKREQYLMQQLLDARNQILAKAHEVCELQAQLAEQLEERQKLSRKVIMRDRVILRFLESCDGSKAPASDAGQNRNVLKTAMESHSILKDGNSHKTSSVKPLAARKSRPMVPEQDAMFSSQITTPRAWQHLPQNSIRQKVLKAATAPSSPRDASRSILASLGQQFKFSTCESSGLVVEPPWVPALQFRGAK